VAGAAGLLRRVRQESATDAASSPVPRGAAVRWAWRAAQVVLTVAVTWAIVRQVGLGVDDLRDLDPSWWRPNVG